MKEFIDHTTLYCVTWLLAYVVFGVFWYVIDRQYFTGLVRWIYNLTHEVPLKDTEYRGIIYGQKAARLFVWGTIISTIQSLGLFFFSSLHSNPFVELVLWLIEIPAMVIGCYLGQALFPLWQKRAKVYDALDKMEERVRKGSQLNPAPTPTPTASPTQGAQAVATPTPTPDVAPQPPSDDPQELMDRFIKKGEKP